MSTLKEEINTILQDGTMSRPEKLSRLIRIVTTHEAHTLLGQAQEDTIVLKKKPYTHKDGMRILNLSIHRVFFDEIIQGTKKNEYRNLTDYYRRRCTYEENGKRYLIPYNAVCFNVGRGKRRLSATVALTGIVCEDGFLIFNLGEILCKSTS